MKKQSSLIALLIAVLIIVLGYFIYSKYLSHLYANNIGQNFQINLQNTSDLSIGKLKGQENIFGIEFELTGKTASNFGVSISNGEQVIHQARIKGGSEVEFIYKNDWYSDSLFLLIEREPLENGILEIECRFLGIK